METYTKSFTRANNTYTVIKTREIVDPAIHDDIIFQDGELLTIQLWENQTRGVKIHVQTTGTRGLNWRRTVTAFSLADGSVGLDQYPHDFAKYWLRTVVAEEGGYGDFDGDFRDIFLEALEKILQ